MAERASAQTERIVADKIVAQIGDKIILSSDIEPGGYGGIYYKVPQYIKNGPALKAGSDSILNDLEFSYNFSKCIYLERHLVEKGLAIQAIRDSIVSDDELNIMLDNQIETFIIQYGSRQELERVAGKSVYQIKEDLRQPFKERKLADEMRAKILDNVHITPTEVKDYFEKIPKDSPTYYESELELSQIIFYPKPNKDVEEYVTNQLLGWKQQVESGQKKFDALARLYSQDPGSRDQGGQYSVNRNDKQWDPTWFAAIWKLKEGQVSPVIKSKFGLHIIQMVSRAGDDAIIRHILMMPSVTQAEIDEAKNKLDSIRTQILTGKISFGEATGIEDGDDGGEITNYDGSNKLTVDILDKNMAVAVKNMNQGDISTPLVYKDDQGRTTVRLVYVRKRIPAHRENFETDYDKIAQSALEKKKNAALQKWFADHIPNFYVSIDKTFCSCVNLSPWLETAKTSNAAK